MFPTLPALATLAAFTPLLTPLGALAAPNAPPAPAQTIVITGGLREAALLEAPYAITSIEAAELRSAGPMVNLSEALARVPGLVAANRNNYAQDLQISARGFGARAGFGVRGVRLYADGIPATMPDGQGQVAHFDLAGAQRVEVLRGPFSALYGNSSGGVIALFTAPATEGLAEAGLDIGSFGLTQARVAVATPLGAAHEAGPGGPAFDLKASASQLQLDGFRPQSEARRTLGQLRLGYTGARDRVTLLLSHHEQNAQDPLGLSRAQFNENPRQTTPQALQFNTRKTVQQTQGGLRWRRAFDEGALREATLAVYSGQRAVVQWLAIAPGTQAGARHGGGVIDFQRDYGGADLRALWRLPGLPGLAAAAEGGTDIAAGVVQEMQTDERQGFENFTGTGAAQQLGVTGRLRRDETNRARTQELYAQLSTPLATRLQLSAGLRSGRVTMSVRDRFLANGDDSGDLGYRYSNPVLGLRWTLAPSWMLHASLARGFESPTLGELAYRPDGSAGFNSGLRGQKSRQFELGSKWRGQPAAFGGLALELDATVFGIRTQDEIGVQTNAGGRSSFQNVGRTERQGLELAAAATLPGGWRSALSLTVLQARYADGFLACAGIPCTAPTVPVPAGNRIAGTQRGSLWAEVQSPLQAWGRVALEWRATSRTAANDTNTEWAPGQGTLNLRWTQRFPLGDGLALEALARVDNLTDKTYAGSVIVNDANGRFFEPAAPRNTLLALRLQQTF
ncbi:iron transporter [beta proteobacterium AAP51]|nr:iron transporter [beta proteobacterium AAP51]